MTFHHIVYGQQQMIDDLKTLRSRLSHCRGIMRFMGNVTFRWTGYLDDPIYSSTGFVDYIMHKINRIYDMSTRADNIYGRSYNGTIGTFISVVEDEVHKEVEFIKYLIELKKKS